MWRSLLNAWNASAVEREDSTETTAYLGDNFGFPMISGEGDFYWPYDFGFQELFEVDSCKHFKGDPKVHTGVYVRQQPYSPRAGCPAVTRRGIFHRELKILPPNQEIGYALLFAHHLALVSLDRMIFTPNAVRAIAINESGGGGTLVELGVGEEV
ncbi:15447_t:CDS:2 [Acaulospora colombiana]|uniref:15447_t:CDS:1 n=1 Tax=Acaulospora colombiana TaxID=27376 RepID=A0ACA9NDP2_9GLOM|nr:15447_t:CDS:2 [Acaulospora colombiana]